MRAHPKPRFQLGAGAAGGRTVTGWTTTGAGSGAGGGGSTAGGSGSASAIAAFPRQARNVTARPLAGR